MSATNPIFLQKLSIAIPNGPNFNMILVVGGPFVIGEGKDTKSLNIPDYYIAEFPVTQELWKAVMKGEEHPSFFQGAQRPKTDVSWKGIKDDFLPSILAQTGKPFRLPSEAEWEYAARGGRHSEGFEYAGSNHLDEVGWYVANSHGETKPVGLKFPNELGLYDMSGNVWEWCEDDWHNNYEQTPDDGSAWVDSPKRGYYRVQRGGGYFGTPEFCRSASRDYWHSEGRDVIFGFRLALSPQFSP